MVQGKIRHQFLDACSPMKRQKKSPPGPATQLVIARRAAVKIVGLCHQRINGTQNIAEKTKMANKYQEKKSKNLVRY